jgi:hypothetical protein
MLGVETVNGNPSLSQHWQAQLPAPLYIATLYEFLLGRGVEKLLF